MQAQAARAVDPDDGDPDGALKAGEQFPTMIANAVLAVLKKR
jgi:hypothetical protein